MRLDKTDKLFRRFEAAERQYSELTTKFVGFADSMSVFFRGGKPIENVTVSKESTEFFKVSLMTVTVGFRLVPSFAPTTGVLVGRVVCTLESPEYWEDKPVLGHFTFKRHGETDFEVSEDDDSIDIEHNAPEIAVQFIQIAIERLDKAIPEM